MKTNYKATGKVYGKYWGGGEGSYQAVQLHGKNKQKMLSEAEKNLDALDDGMGYETVLGAMYEVETITTITKDGKEYNNSEFETVFLGDLTEEQQDFLEFN